MTSKVAVFIGATSGPVRIEKIGREEVPISEVFVGTSIRALQPMSDDYHNFVSAGRPVAKAFSLSSDPGFKLQLSSEIKSGNSWELAVFVAHGLAARGALAMGDDAYAHSLWLTGRVDAEFTIGKVGDIPAKLHRADGFFGKQPGVIRVVPSAVRADVPDGFDVLDFDNARDLFDHIIATVDPHAGSDPARPDPPEGQAPSGRKTRRGVMVAVLVSAVLAAAGSAAFMMQMPPAADAPSPGPIADVKIEAPVAKTTVAKTTVAKTTVAKPPVARTPEPETPATEAPATETPVTDKVMAESTGDASAPAEGAVPAAPATEQDDKQNVRQPAPERTNEGKTAARDPEPPAVDTAVRSGAKPVDGPLVEKPAAPEYDPKTESDPKSQSDPQSQPEPKSEATPPGDMAKPPVQTDASAGAGTSASPAPALAPGKLRVYALRAPAGQNCARVVFGGLKPDQMPAAAPSVQPLCAVRFVADAGRPAVMHLTVTRGRYLNMPQSVATRQLPGGAGDWVIHMPQNPGPVLDYTMRLRDRDNQEIDLKSASINTGINTGG